jgi:hypothetical protein
MPKMASTPPATMEDGTPNTLPPTTSLAT